jgi:8-oxo-dGTP diphosphatase
MMKPLRVTAGVVWKEGSVLLARRSGDDPLSGCWEFPGGRIEPGETPEACLGRELLEELGIRVRVRRLLDTVCHEYPEKRVELLFIEADYDSGDISLGIHDDVAWVAPADLPKYDLAAADDVFVRRHFPRC